MKQKNLNYKIGLLKSEKILKSSLKKKIKVGSFLKVVLLKRDPLTLKGYFEEIKGFCIRKSRKGGILKLGNIVKQVRFFYSFHVQSLSVKNIKLKENCDLPRRALVKKKLI